MSDVAEGCTAEHWSVPLIRRRLEGGLQPYLEPIFVRERYARFQKKVDPFFSRLLRGLDEPALARAFVTHWTLGQTLATQLRFWLEAAIIDCLVHQALELGRGITHVWCPAFAQDSPVPIHELGESHRERMTMNRPVPVLVQRSALREIDLIVGAEELDGGLSALLALGVEEGEATEMLEHRDADHLRRVAAALDGPPLKAVRIRCNLVVIEPARRDSEASVYAVRYVNPNVMRSPAARKQERANLLRIVAWLAQEKAFRHAGEFDVRVAELLPPREASSFWDREAQYFTARTSASSEQLWHFLGIPPDCVMLAIEQASGALRASLRAALLEAAPEVRPGDRVDRRAELNERP